MRYDCFNKLVDQASSAVLLSKLLPTTEDAHQHCRRTFHHVQTWQDQCVNPSSWGRKLVTKSLTPIYTTKEPAPAKIASRITCGCNKGCGKKCKCVRTNLHCTTLYRNCRGQSCIYTEAIDIIEEEEEYNDII
ncbi:hypothetical protein AVEN_25232-1 [Araneus ventricosus]|uniref:Tesmin/TSO1-like CXC domain-containing protein n=1 Tax=Araneus ventricosus TaxID=182803 RepID=A0A4Y2M1L6_ARAVE|nr:hypothetical protein AVEN_25232-1 [Araneus ventricosus]